MNARPPYLVTLASAAFALLLFYAGVTRSVEDKAIRPLEFKLRSFLQKSPRLDPRLKIYSYDDATLRYVRKADLNFELWLKVLQGIAEVRPKRILIDKFFSVVEHGLPSEELQSRLQALAGDPITAVFATQSAIVFQAPLSPTTPAFSMRRWAGRDVTVNDFRWLPIKPGSLYGPDPELLSGFKNFGHVIYHHDGRVDLFQRYDAAHAVPHWSLLAADELQLTERGLRIGGLNVPDVGGQVAVNMIDVEVLERNLWRMVPLIRKVEKGQPLTESIKPDQYVVILPSMFTGSADMVETPIGRVPGPYVVLSMLNSVLTGQWILTWPASIWEILLFAGLAWLLTLRFHAVGTPILLLLIFLSTIGSGLLAFGLASVQVPWFGASLAFFVSGVANLLWIAMQRVQEAQKVSRAISGLVPPEQIKTLLKEHKALEFEPSGHVVSIMFVDIVGFSLTTKKLSAAETFNQLKALLGDITEIVHRHQGTIDKTLGDGLLCFFGYNVLGQSSEHHADQAVRCAIDIQRQVYQRSMQAFADGKALYPLRIGINTSSVFIGNIGNRQRFDFTMIGDGVNFAARLETACAPFKIMIGPSTKAQLIDFSPDHPSMLKRYVMVKHTADLLEAWEVDPFHNTGEDVERLEKLYWNYAGIFQREDRYPVHQQNVIRLQTHLGQFHLKNYSFSGFGLQSDIFLAQGVVFNLTLETDDLLIQKELRQWGLSSLIVEICWGSQRHDQYEHGVRFVGLNQEQKTRIFELLHSRHRESLPKPS